MKKNFKKSKFVILPALATLVLTSVATVTGTAAWFTASREVSASGMSFTAKSESNLLIAGDELTNTKKQEEGKFSSSLTKPFANASLKPASTINGKAFFKTSTAKADGAIQDGAIYEEANNQTNDDSRYYLDYVFQLKAINTESASQSIYVNEISVNYSAATVDTVDALTKAAKAFRIAFFIEARSTTAGQDFNADTTKATNAKFIYQPKGAANQTPGQAVKKTSSGQEHVVGALGDVSYFSDETSDKAYATVATGTFYFKGVARVWMEGEDINCTSDLFQHAADKWSIDLGFGLGDVNDTKKPVKTNIDIKVDTANA